MQKPINHTINLTSEAHYYPFGLQINALSYTNPLQRVANKYLYNGKELQDDFGLGWYDYGKRFYDAEVGRFHSIDPMSQFASPYIYAANNPILMIDPSGMYSFPVYYNGVLHHIASDGKKEEDSEKDNNSNDDTDNNTSKPPDWYIDNETGKVVWKDGSSEHEGFTHLGYGPKKAINVYGISSFMKLYAYLIRNSITEIIPNTGIGLLKINPFYKAEAISGDLGIVLGGTEYDGGGILVLAGNDAGKIIPYGEIGYIGIAPEVSTGLEFGRIDYTGNVKNFTSNMLLGERTKIWGGIDVGPSLGAGVAWGKPIRNPNYIISTTLSIGVGASPFAISGGLNHGIVIKLTK